ncbi:MAG: aminotransferase class V-fold PLP-dependent enzyme [Bacteroidota bacterium]
MDEAGINFSTGPVNISTEVRQALIAPSVSHRSATFQKLYNSTATFLCEQFNTKNVFFITGSGTAANEMMIWQIKMRGGKGLILSNGEFGLRLIEQSKRASLQFAEYNLNFGEPFDLKKIETIVTEEKIKWVLLCHCETSTGVVYDLDLISTLCAKNNCSCYVDCMSTVGTNAIDLSQVTMATASSGKGFASVAGLGIIFSNTALITSSTTPLYLDLSYYLNKNGIPFTLSSNLLNALYVSIKQKFLPEQMKLIDHYSYECFQVLRSFNLLPFSNEQSKVFTISPGNSIREFAAALTNKQVITSYESGYLRQRNLLQIAFFGYYQKTELDKLLTALKESIGTTSGNFITTAVR